MEVEPHDHHKKGSADGPDLGGACSHNSSAWKRPRRVVTNPGYYRLLADEDDLSMVDGTEDVPQPSDDKSSYIGSDRDSLSQPQVQVTARGPASSTHAPPPGREDCPGRHYIGHPSRSNVTEPTPEDQDQLTLDLQALPSVSSRVGGPTAFSRGARLPREPWISKIYADTTYIFDNVEHRDKSWEYAESESQRSAEAYLAKLQRARDDLYLDLWEFQHKYKHRPFHDALMRKGAKVLILEDDL